MRIYGTHLLHADLCFSLIFDFFLFNFQSILDFSVLAEGI